MVYFEKSQPAPPCLQTEKAKTNGDYKCGEVLRRLQADFKNKCYLCESKAPTTINVEHFRPHRGNVDLKFDWNNLFWACGHCNNTKLGNYDNLLDCTDDAQNVERQLKYRLNQFPIETVEITVLNESPAATETKNLLHAIYNGTTQLKAIEASNLREKLQEELIDFQDCLKGYFENNTQEYKDYLLRKITAHLSRSSNFTAFKRWIVLENEVFRPIFEVYFD